MIRTLHALVAGILITVTLSAEEGMWLFNRPPRDAIRARYNFELSDEWLAHLQKASIRFGRIGSAAFVSADGLILTNHHVGRDCIAAVGGSTHDYVRDGFSARSRADELACPGLEINVLDSITDVTTAVNTSIRPDMHGEAAEAARRAAVAELEKASTDDTGLLSQVVTLYQGGEYHLYRYKRYTEVRLVFAPEEAIAFFGGDPDNFEYPRFSLDFSFFRAYENGAPARVEHFLRVNPSGLREGDPVFISGHPGSTARQKTVTQLLFERDVQLPFNLNTIRRGEVLLGAWSKRSAENARRANTELKGLENARKALLGFLSGLQDPTLLARKRSEEERLRSMTSLAVSGSADPWSTVDGTVRFQREHFLETVLIDSFAGFGSPLLHDARTLLRYAEETAKPNGERLREFGDAGLQGLREALVAETPVSPEIEAIRIADWLSMWAESRPDDPLLAAVLDGKPPVARAAALVRATRMHEAAARRALLDGGRQALVASPDSMVALARMLEPRARELRARWETTVEEPLRQANAQIATLRFKAEGTSVYPDATFTLRFGYGTVTGHRDDASVFPWSTQMAGLFARAAEHAQIAPFALPQRWRAAQARVDGTTPLNFVSTTDIIGGNSGSPVVNRDGEYVGLVFDGNQRTLAYNYAYSDVEARSINVHAGGIVEALRKVYRADALLKELLPPVSKGR